MTYMQNDSQENQKTNKSKEMNGVLGHICAHLG